jgi:predicted Zn-dependent peptidase
MSEVREKRGLTYGVYSVFSPMQVRGPFMINLQTRAELSEGTLKLVQDVLADYLKNGPTQQELDDAKRELAGSFPLSTASNADIVGQLGAIGFYNLPLSWLEDFMQQSQALTVEQVKAAMNKHLAADKLVIVTVGPTCRKSRCRPPLTNLPSNRSGYRSTNGKTTPPRRHAKARANCASSPASGAAAAWRCRKATACARPRARNPVQLAGAVHRGRPRAGCLHRQRAVARSPVRGAQDAVALDSNPAAIANLKHNLELLRCPRGQIRKPTPCATCKARPSSSSTWCSSTRRSTRTCWPTPATCWNRPVAARAGVDLHRKRGRAVEPADARQLAPAPREENRAGALRALAAHQDLSSTAHQLKCPKLLRSSLATEHFESMTLPDSQPFFADPCGKPPLQHFVLDNGLNVYLQEDPRSPLACVQLCYHVGASHDPLGHTNLTHLLEHMLFEGSAKLAPGQFSRVISRLGGGQCLDPGRWHRLRRTLPAARLEVALEILGDTMANASLTADGFERAVKAVNDERRLKLDNNPEQQAFEHHKRLAHGSSPTPRPVSVMPWTFNT